MNERRTALEVLMDITAGNGYNNIVLKRTLAGRGDMRREQKAFITEVVNGTLRNMILLDYIINQTSKTNTRQMEPYVLNLLRLSVYQLKFMDKIPAWSVCDEAVKIIGDSQSGYLKGFINGVLRNILRKMTDIDLELEKIKSSDKPVYLEIKYSCPRWLVKRFIDYIGPEDAEKTLNHTQDASGRAVTACVNTLKTTAAELAALLDKEGVLASPGMFMPNALRLKRTSDISRLAAFSSGLFHVMDESAMLAAAVSGVREGGSFLDVCAAPGGKTFMAAYAMNGIGTIHARDVFPHKIKLLEEGKRRLGLNNIQIELKDALVRDEASVAAFDTVLVDAPCSGLGLIGKKPEIKYTKTNEDILEMQSLQRRILTICSEYIKPGGSLVYCTCTLTPEENEQNADWFLKNFPFKQADITGALPKGLNETGTGYVKVLPHEYGTDGFFIAKFVSER